MTMSIEHVGIPARSPAGLPARNGIGVVVRGLAFVPVARGLWRVTTDSGAIRGHIEAVPGSSGDRFEARRVRPDGGSESLGAFWDVRDAIDCFR